MSDIEPVLYTLPPLLFEEDAAQERELARLEGRVPRRFNRWVSGRAREYGYGLVPGEGAMSAFAPLRPDPAVVEALISWVRVQAGQVKLEVLRYLDNPGPDELERIRALVSPTLASVKAAGPREVTLSELVLRALPATTEALYTMARSEHRSKRPEAAVRQTIRNLSRRGTITANEEGTWHPTPTLT